MFANEYSIMFLIEESGGKEEDYEDTVICKCIQLFHFNCRGCHPSFNIASFNNINILKLFTRHDLL